MSERMDEKMSTRWLCTRTAAEIIELLKKKEVTPERLIRVVEERIEEVNGALHAVVTTCFDRAREKLRELEADMERMEHFPPGFLYGMPVLIKDTNYLKGVRFSVGFYTEEEDAEHVAKAGLIDSDPLVLQIERMGGIAVAKTNVPEFGAGSHSFNNLFPTCVNPFDTRTAGSGSSGGAASALAGCVCWLAQGSDLGGSLRTPAAFNGIVAIRTTPGVVPQSGPCNPNPYALHGIQGPMARTVLDTAIFLDTMTTVPGAGRDTKLPGWENLTGDPPRPLDGVCEGSWRMVAEAGIADAGRKSFGYRIAFSTLGVKAVTSEMREVCRGAAQVLVGDAGSFTEVDEPFDAHLAKLLFIIMRSESYRRRYGTVDVDGDGLSKLTLAQKKRLKPAIKWNMRYYGKILELDGGEREDGSRPTAVAKAYRDSEHVIGKQVDALFSGCDILCVPASNDAPFDAAIRYPVPADPNEAPDFLAWMRLACNISQTGCPSIVIPVGLSTDGRPLAMQLVGKRGDDARVLRAAATLEALLDLDFVPRLRPDPVKGSCSLDVQACRTAEQEEALHVEAQKVHDGWLQEYISRA